MSWIAEHEHIVNKTAFLLYLLHIPSKYRRNRPNRKKVIGEQSEKKMFKTKIMHNA